MKILNQILLCCAVFMMIVTLSASGQTLQRGAIRGTVLDRSHAAIPNAKVTLLNPATGIARDQMTGADGSYAFNSVTPGEYTITAEATGFATTTVKNAVVNVGSSLTVDIDMPLKSAEQSVTVSASTGAVVDTQTAGITQLLNSTSVQNLPFPGRDYRDLATLSPSAQVVPGLRGGLRLGGQQSDYSGLVIDGADTTNNFFGENFGSLETKNLTIPLEAVQEFQVVTNGFAPEFGRATGGLLNVVTKSGTNEVHGEAHEYYRSGSLTANDALGNPSNISKQNQFGGSVGFPIRRNRQFLFLSTDVQRENGPLITSFCAPGPGAAACQAGLAAEQGPLIPANVTGAAILLPSACAGMVGEHLLPACYGVPNLAALEGTSNQFANFFTLLGHYDYQFSPSNHFSVRGFGTRNHTSGFTGGRGQTEIQAAFDNTETYVNQGISGVFSLTTVLGRKVNEIRVGIQGETRVRHPNVSGASFSTEGPPEINILGVGIFGQRFFLPANNDNGKLEGSDNFTYSFGKHDIKFGGGVAVFVDRKDIFAGWNAGTYSFGGLCFFDPNPANCAGVVPPPVAPSPFGFEQGFGLNGRTVFEANTLFPNYQSGMGLYWQDKWSLTPRLTLTYGLRWDGTWNPQPQTPIPGQEVRVGAGAGTRIVPVPQRTPNDFSQWGPRIGIAWNVAGGDHPTVVRAAWGYYYAQLPTIFFPQTSNGGGSLSATLFCFSTGCLPGGGAVNQFPYVFPSSLPISVNQLCASAEGCPNILYTDPSFKNPQVSNLTVGVEHSFTHDIVVSANYVYVHSTHLRTGGFSTTNWFRNFQIAGTDQFGAAQLLNYTPGSCANITGAQPFTQPLDCTIGTGSNELGSFGRANFNQLVLAINKRFSNRYQFFANYTWSQNYSNASSERDTDTFFGPQDPINVNLDYGLDGLDITQQFKAGYVVQLPLGFTWSGNFIVHSGLAYPAYLLPDVNGDGVFNQAIAGNDRPIVQLATGKPFLLPDYPARQPNYFNWDTRIAKDFNFHERYQIRLSADLFNLTNASNLYSNPDNSAFVNAPPCVFNPAPLAGCVRPVLNAIPTPGTASGLPMGIPPYRTLDQISPGATPFAFQAGIRFQF
jgi:hypothetical protein